MKQLNKIPIKIHLLYRARGSRSTENDLKVFSKTILMLNIGTIANNMFKNYANETIK